MPNLWNGQGHRDGWIAMKIGRTWIATFIGTLKIATLLEVDK